MEPTVLLISGSRKHGAGGSWQRTRARLFFVRHYGVGSKPVWQSPARLGWFCPATAGSVFRASTSPEFTDFFPRLKNDRSRDLLSSRQLAVDVLYLLLDPSHAADLDRAVLPNQEQSRNVRKPIGIRNHVTLRIVQQGAKRNPVLFEKSGSVALVILRNPDDRDFLCAAGSMNALKIRKCILAGLAGNFEERGQNRPVFESILKGELAANQGS